MSPLRQPCLNFHHFCGIITWGALSLQVCRLGHASLSLQLLLRPESLTGRFGHLGGTGSPSTAMGLACDGAKQTTAQRRPTRQAAPTGGRGEGQAAPAACNPVLFALAGNPGAGMLK